MKLGRKVFENREFLERLNSARGTVERNLLLRQASTENIIVLVEICSNILKFRVPLTKSQKIRLAKHAEKLRNLVRARTEKSARAVLEQQGSGYFVAGILAPILAELARVTLSGP